MDDLISRQDAIDALAVADAKKGWRSLKFSEMHKCLSAIPSAQPRKGKWLKAGTRMGIPLFECSLCECGEEVPTVMGKPSYNFCPYCGCRMEEGDSDD